MRIYVGNLSFKTTEDSLRDLFSRHGEVVEVAIVKDRETGRPRGFAFVTMGDDASAQTAIEQLNGYEFEGRAISVNEARPRVGGGSGGGEGGGGGWRGGGGRGDRGGRDRDR